MVNPVVFIPARMASSRLPQKPLADICGEPMIAHVWRRAMEADVGPVFVATDDPMVVEAVETAGGRAIMTRPDHQSGSDRIFEALGAVDPAGNFDAVLNIQGDLPTIERAAVRACLKPLADRAVDIATLATAITRPEEGDDPNVVKAIGTEIGPGRLRALYFTRARAPWGKGQLLHHIGLYAYKRDALKHFVDAPPSPLERRERLEQLRALEMGQRIDIMIVDAAPLGVDTQADLERARIALAHRKDR
jgi:3-deoxy-manno-octulosonate cytidylyltransferase (CMP-KDO synthetase)